MPYNQKPIVPPELGWKPLLKQLIVNLIDNEGWMSLPVDVKGTIYEELLQSRTRV